METHWSNGVTKWREVSDKCLWQVAYWSKANPMAVQGTTLLSFYPLQSRCMSHFIHIANRAVGQIAQIAARYLVHI